MKQKTIPIEWIKNDDWRLDAGPYLSGALECRIRLGQLKCRKDQLKDLTTGHNGGIYNGPQFTRNYVSNSEIGVPFLGSSSMMRADLSSLPRLNKRDAISKKLVFLKLKPKMTLISCSGTVGRMAYTRQDMVDVWSSQDILKVVPDESKIQPGYVYAYLSSKFGIPMVTSGTYGGVIQHIEPKHIEDLPIPRFGDKFENEIAKMIDDASSYFVDYQFGVNSATKRFFECFGISDLYPGEWHERGRDLDFCAEFPRLDSFRALNFNPRFNALVEQLRGLPHKSLVDVCIPGTLRRGGRFKRIDADPIYALKLVGQKHLFWFHPEGRWIAKSALGEDVVVEPGCILIAARGTLGESELYSRAEFAWGDGLKLAYSEDILRIISDPNIIMRGCLFAFMRSEMAFRMLRSASMGSKLQDHHYSFRDALPVPLPPMEVQEKIHNLVVAAYEARHKGVALENQARVLVEKAIEEAN